MELTRVTIVDRIHWNERLTWLERESLHLRDLTQWYAWQIGHTDIEVMVDQPTAVLYYLTWGA